MSFLGNNFLQDFFQTLANFSLSKGSGSWEAKDGNTALKHALQNWCVKPENSQLNKPKPNNFVHHLNYLIALNTVVSVVVTSTVESLMF